MSKADHHPLTKENPHFQTSDHYRQLHDSPWQLDEPSSLNHPRRLFDPETNLPSLTSLFEDLRPIAEDPDGVSVLYIHLPSSAIIEERFGAEALQAYFVLVANYLSHYAQELRYERTHCLVLRIFADDFVIIAPERSLDDQLPLQTADNLLRHLAAVDEEIADIIQISSGAFSLSPHSKSPGRCFRCGASPTF